MGIVKVGFRTSVIVAGFWTLLFVTPTLAQNGDVNRSGRNSLNDRMILWNTLASGMSASDVVTALAAMKVRATVAPGEGVKVRDKVVAGGIKASVEPAFVSGGLFWVDLIYSVGADKDHDEFDRMVDALSAKYGPAESKDGISQTVMDNTAGVITRREASFFTDGLRVDLTVNRTFYSSSNAVSDTAIIRYWRDMDSKRYRDSERRKAEREKQMKDKRNSEGF